MKHSIHYLTSSLEAEQPDKAANNGQDLDYWASLNEWLDNNGLMQADGSAAVYRQITSSR